MADDYAPAQVYDDEEEELKKGLYPPAIAPAQPAPRMDSYAAPTDYPDVPQPAAPPMPAAIPQTPTGPNLSQDVMGGAVAAPTLQPAHRSMRNRIASGLAAFKSPEVGMQIAEQPEQQAEKQYAAESGQYNAALAAGERNRTFQSEDALRKSQITRNDALAKKAGEPTPIGKTPEESTLHDLMTGNNGQPRVNPKTGQPYNYLDAYQAVNAARQETNPEPKKNAKEEIQEQLSAELAKPTPDRKVVKGLQDRLRAIDPLAEDRIKDAEGRAADAQKKGSEKTDIATREKVLTYYKPAQDADSRLVIMRESLDKALKGDQQAMVNLVAQHIGMVLGIPRGKVGRPSQQLFQEAEQSSDVLSRAEAHFDKKGYLTGIVLTPDQMKQMVSLGEDTQRQEWDTANRSADYLGIDKNDRPKSTIEENKTGREAEKPQAPQGATDEVYAKDGTTLIGHVVNGKYVPLKKK